MTFLSEEPMEVDLIAACKEEGLTRGFDMARLNLKPVGFGLMPKARSEVLFRQIGLFLNEIIPFRLRVQ
jgi:hypothetical protein